MTMLKCMPPLALTIKWGPIRVLTTLQLWSPWAQRVEESERGDLPSTM